MGKRIVSVFVMFVFLAGLIGCSSIPEERKGAATGAGVGAATGAAAGAILGSKGAKTEMAVLGGLLGALAGGAIGHYAYDQKRTGKETADKYKYESTRGSMVTIEKAEATPKTVKPGDTVDMKMTYALLGVAGTTTVTETREIRQRGELFGKPQTTVSKGEGTFESNIPLILPSDAPKGRYDVTMTVQAANSSDSKETSFEVE